MTAITAVGSNAAVSGNNASLNPTIHGSATDGDLLVLFATIRNTAATVNPISDWSVLFASGNVVALYRTFATGMTAPTVTFTGGAAGDTTIARIAVFRTAYPFLRALVASVNASAQNITLPAAFTPGRAGGLVMYMGWKQSVWTSVAALSGTTRIGADSVATGSGAAQIWDYTIQTAAATTTAGPWVVTGGASAVSQGVVVVLDQAAAVSTLVQSVYPPRVLVSVTNLNIGDAVTVYRRVAGQLTPIRAGSTAATTDTAFLVTDAELPYGVPVTYVATVSGADYLAGPTTYTLTNGKVALSDAITGASAEVVILAWENKQQQRPSSTFVVGGRNVFVSGDLPGFTGEIELYVDATSSVDNVRSLLRGSTEGIIQVRQPGGYDGVDCYIAVDTVTERRWSQDGTDPRRRIVLRVTEVEAWSSSLQAANYTLQNLADAYVGQTLLDFSDDYPTLLALAQASL